MAKQLHIVCLDAPSPPDYGGAIDMYYKISALAVRGVQIHLHYFDYRQGRGAGELASLCREVHAYGRKSFLSSRPFALPFITGSRINTELISRLNADDHPVLLEGLHCAGVLPYLNRPSRAVLRMHNQEADYYRELARNEANPLRRLYFRLESRSLHRFQLHLPKTLLLACLAKTDQAIFESTYHFTRTHFIPCFIPWQTISGPEGKGYYCLYHGNLAVNENEAAALWLINNVFSKITLPLVIAGNGASARLTREAARWSNVRLVLNPPMEDLNGLIRDAHINVLPSLNRTGVKLKLLHALYCGRFCITNRQGVEGSEIRSGVIIAEDSDQWAQALTECWEQPFTAEQRKEREAFARLYNNDENAKKLSELW
jgi:glycosyltransferase involved in cell wall biosynthesis